MVTGDGAVKEEGVVKKECVVKEASLFNTRLSNRAPLGIAPNVRGKERMCSKRSKSFEYTSFVYECRAPLGIAPNECSKERMS